MNFSIAMELYSIGYVGVICGGAAALLVVICNQLKGIEYQNREFQVVKTNIAAFI